MKKFHNYIYLLTGFLIVFYTIYIRLIIIRLPRELHMFNPTNYKLIYIVFVGIFISAFIIWNSIKNIFNMEKEPLYILKYIKEFLSAALYEVYYFIGSLSTNTYQKVSTFTESFYNIFRNKSEMVFPVIQYVVRFIIVFAFLIDIFVFFRLQYFYKILFLLAIPLFINLIFFFMQKFAENLEEIQSCLVIEITGYDKETKEPLTTFTLSQGNEEQDLSYNVEQFIICSKITGYLHVYDFLINYYTPRVNIIIYTLYLIGWLYVLTYNIITYI